MNFEKHFREQDIPEAIKEIKCIEDLMRLVLLNIHSGGLGKAEKRLYEVLRSIEQLMYLNEAKRNEDMIMTHKEIREILEEFFNEQNQTLHN